MNKDTEYVANELDSLLLSEIYSTKIKISGGLGGNTKFINITLDQFKAVKEILLQEVK